MFKLQLSNNTFWIVLNIFILIFLLEGNIYSQNSIKDTDTLFWNSERKLRWSDFKGIPVDTIIIEPYHIKPKGISYVILMCKIQNKADLIKTYVSPVFIRSRSWIRDTNEIRLLEHEQIHFDLCELYARKLRKEYANLIKKKAKLSLFDSVYQEINNKLELINDKFDDETFYGTIKESQDQWRRFVDKSLSELEKYSSDKESCYKKQRE